METVGSEGSELAHTPGVFVAKRVVITVPLGFCRRGRVQGAIKFDPELPGGQAARTIAQLRMGTVVKAVLRFREPFWEKCIPELDFIHAAVGRRSWRP